MRCDLDIIAVYNFSNFPAGRASLSAAGQFCVGQNDMIMNEVNKWKQRGEVYFWRYIENTRNYPGWHLAIDRHGSASFMELIVAFLSCNHMCMRTLSLRLPDSTVLSVPNNIRSRIYSKDKLRLHWDPHRESQWSIEEHENVISIQVGKEMLFRVQHALENPRDAFDTIIASDPTLWFWGIIN